MARLYEFPEDDFQADVHSMQMYVLSTYSDRGISSGMDFWSYIAAVNQGSTTPEDNEGYWNTFHDNLVSQRTSLEKMQSEHPWGVWRLEEDGEVDEPTLWEGRVIQREGSFTKIRRYNAPPTTVAVGSGFGIIEWNFTVAMQGNREVFIGAQKVGEIDAVCSVPHLPDYATMAGTASSHLANWALTPAAGLQQWQRRPDVKRVHSIKTFVDSSDDNLIVNSLMLYIPVGAPGVSVIRNADEQTAKVIIDPNQFLIRRGNEFTDIEENHTNDAVNFNDLRPIWIVDGQHRTRGMAASYRGFDMSIPLILLEGGDEPGKVSLTDVAKIFTEINTLAKPLEFEQHHYLARKFSIPSPSPKTTYGLPEQTDSERDRKNRRANRMAYELAARLTAEPSGSFENGVQLVSGRSPASAARIPIKKFLEEARKWFLSGDGGVYDDPSNTMDMIFPEVSSYIDAWMETVNHNDYTHLNNVPRWTPGSMRNHSMLEHNQTTRVVIIRQYPFFRKLLVHRNLEINKDSFRSVLAPVRGVDWHRAEMDNYFVRSGEMAANWLAHWIKQAVLNNVVYTVDEVCDYHPENVGHGKALFAGPSTASITIEEGALGHTFELLWRNGNVFTRPRVSCYNNGVMEAIEDVVWEFASEEDFQPKFARCKFVVDLEQFSQGWRIDIHTENKVNTTDITIDESNLGDFID
jgi:hypothetical protein